MTKTIETIVEKIEQFITKHVIFRDSTYSLPMALWVIGTFMFPDFDAFPYLVITADTKRAGKTRCAEMLSFCCSNPSFSAAMTPAAMFQEIEESQPTIFWDEAEVLNSEAATVLRQVLNAGYRKGSTVKRTAGKTGVREYKTYCPKCFILIGDVNDTLRDRSIVLRMRRAEMNELQTRFVYTMVKDDGAALRAEIAVVVDEMRFQIAERYQNFVGIEFLSDRDEEIWTPLFVLCESLAAHRTAELRRTAIDMSMEKTVEARRMIELKSEEAKEQFDEFSYRLLGDLLAVMDGQKAISTADAIAKLRAIDTAPWRKYKGEGITMFNISDMLSPFGVKPVNIRFGTGRENSQVKKGYKRADLVAAAAKNAPASKRD